MLNGSNPYNGITLYNLSVFPTGVGWTGRWLLMDKMEQLLEVGRQRGVDVWQVPEIIIGNERNVALNKLRELGYALVDLASYYNLSRARISQVTVSGFWARPRDGVDRTVEEIKNQVWRESCNDLSWWGGSGRLNRDRIVRLFVDANYAWQAARCFSKQVAANSLDVLLAIKFKIMPEEQAVSLQKKIDEMDTSKWVLFDQINEGQKLKISRVAFERRWARIGIRAPRRLK